jgi:hypothetical protein
LTTQNRLNLRLLTGQSVNESTAASNRSTPAPQAPHYRGPLACGGISAAVKQSQRMLYGSMRFGAL